jgi:hypothetical protein
MTFNFDVNNLVRSVLIAAAVAPLTFAAAGAINTATQGSREGRELTAAQVVVNEHRDALTKACIDFRVSKPDSTLEREAKTTIDKFMGGEVLYGPTCNWILGLK